MDLLLFLIAPTCIHAPGRECLDLASVNRGFLFSSPHPDSGLRSKGRGGAGRGEENPRRGWDYAEKRGRPRPLPDWGGQVAPAAFGGAARG